MSESGEGPGLGAGAGAGTAGRVLNMATELQAPAWERRLELGFWLALWRTWRDSVFRPVPFFRAVPPRNDRVAALVYFLLVSGVGLFFSQYWGTLENILGGGVGSTVGDELGPALTGPQQIALMVISSGVVFVFLLLINFAALFLSAAVVHVGFLWVRAGRQGFGATLRALAYSAGPLAFLVFPFFGQLLALVWSSVVVFIAVREVQRTTNGRATAGFLLPVVAVMLLLVLASFIVALLVTTADIGAAL